ncbi:MAG: hypothetical protein LAO56_16130 [Acidobacteriia bacterium]|nr:hypothetical protein [Terriglobia bacterium]
MKKTGLLLVLLASLAAAQPSVTSTMVATPDASGIVSTSVNVPFVRYQTPTAADIYCAGFISKERLPDANYVNGGLQSPTSTKFETGELVYLAGRSYQAGQLYSIVRELRDVNEYEIYPGERKLLKDTGHPYGEIGRVRVLDIRSHSAIAQVVYSCDPINPGDVAVPFSEKPMISFHVPGHFDRFAPSSGKLSGRIVLGKDFDDIMGTGMKLYMNMGSNQGVKVGDYFRVMRSYTSTLHDPVDSLSFKAQTSEDTQMRPPTYEGGFFSNNYATKAKGPNIHVADLPRRAVGEVVVLNVTPTTSSAMVVFALEDVYAGDDVELDESAQ